MLAHLRSTNKRKSRMHLNLLGARRVPRSKFSAEGPHYITLKPTILNRTGGLEPENFPAAIQDCKTENGHVEIYEKFEVSNVAEANIYKGRRQSLDTLQWESSSVQ